MPSLFLSHTRVDKPFVEKLANDLKRFGINVWFDKWEIKVGDSITWKIADGIRENEYLGIVLSPEALQSEWVKTELSAAWVKQMQSKKVVVLPILLRDCDIPLFLADRRYADFRNDYHDGLKQLSGVLGVRETNILSEENWRRFAKSRLPGWKRYSTMEFETLVTLLVDRAQEYNWSSWVGGKKNPNSITLSAIVDPEKKESVSLKLSGRTFAYMASLEDAWNPNHLKSSDFDIYVGNSVNECEEFVWRRMEDFRRRYGDPIGKPHHCVERFATKEEVREIAEYISKQFSWYKGDKKPGQQ